MADPNTGESKLQLRQLLSELRPDCVVFGRSFPVYFSVLAWCVDQGIPAVLLSDSTAYDFKRYAWKEWIKVRITQLYSASFVAGSRHREYLMSLGMASDKIVPGYNVVDNAHFSIGADQTRAHSHRFQERLSLPECYFLVSCRFLEKKNLFRLLDGYAEYLKQEGVAAWSLVLLGDGPLRSQLEERVVSLGLTDRIVLPGFKPYDVLPAYYGLADAFILASSNEQWGLVVNEAMAAGLSVLVSDRCGCAPDLVRNGVNGFTFDQFDIQELSARMGDIFSSGCDRDAMSRASREIISRWTVETYTSSLERVVDCSMSASRPKASMLDKMLLWALGPK